ncbi:MAG: winged helix-turn-helix transcriptional regulator [Syntrophomonadaceae bacterium]|nr:winged helix-turn-helix transcriptional regulator [Syntrophomonadaceae bacterium]
MPSDECKSYAAVFKALGDETRLKIFRMLSCEEKCACKILDEFDISQSTLSYHMKILCDCGLVNGRRDGIWMRYTINADTLARVRDFFARIEPAEPMADLDNDRICC